MKKSRRIRRGLKAPSLPPSSSLNGGGTKSGKMR